MDPLVATVEVIKAIAWPLAALVIFLSIRKQLLELIPFIQTLKALGVEVSIRRDVQDAKTLAPPPPAVPESNQSSAVQKPTRHQELYALAEVAARSAISEAWRDLETEGVQAANRLGAEALPKALRTSMSFGEGLRKARLITGDQYNAIARLRKIRNEAVHLADFSIEEQVVRDYVDTALGLAKELAAVAPQMQSAT
jgi:hypothetical protein